MSDEVRKKVVGGIPFAFFLHRFFHIPYYIYGEWFDLKFKLTVIFANILQYLIKVPSLANQDEFVFSWYMLALVDIRHSPAHLYLCQYYGYCHHGIF